MCGHDRPRPARDLGRDGAVVHRAAAGARPGSAGGARARVRDPTHRDDDRGERGRRARRAQSEERLQGLVQRTSDITMVIRPDGVLRWVSPAFERVLGYRAEDVIGTRALQFAHADDVDKARQALLCIAKQNGKAGRVEVRIRHRRYVPVVRRERDEPDRRTGRGGHGREPPRHQRAHTRAARACGGGGALRNAFEGAPIGMALVDLDGRIFRTNRSMAQIFGYEPHESCSGSWSPTSPTRKTERVSLTEMRQEQS